MRASVDVDLVVDIPHGDLQLKTGNDVGQIIWSDSEVKIKKYNKVIVTHQCFILDLLLSVGIIKICSNIVCTEVFLYRYRETSK